MLVVVVAAAAAGTAPDVVVEAPPEEPPLLAAADGRKSLVALVEVLLRALAELVALVRISLCSLNPSLLCCDDVDSLEVGGESFFFWFVAAPLVVDAADAALAATVPA